MTTYKAAQMPNWARKVEGILNAIIQQATNDLLNDIEIVPGINRGGSRVRGTIPRDTGILAGSLQSTLYGSTAISAAGKDSYNLVVGQMKVGSVAKFVWGGGAAPYARAVHYGYNGVPGTFWIEVAANGWAGYVRNATIRAKVAIR